MLLCTPLRVRAELVWKMGDPLLTDASQITSNNSQSGFPPENLLRPESEGYGTGQIIWHTSWGNPAVPPAGTDTYLQVHFNEAEQHIFFKMIGSMWNSTYDTPTEMIIQGANLPDGEWTEIIHLTHMENDFTSIRPDKYTSPHIDLGAEYSYLRFVVKKTMNDGNSSRYDSNGNPFVSLGRFQIYEAYEGEPDPVGPSWKKDEALITDPSQIIANSSQNGFPTDNLLRPESDGVGTNQYIWHTAWSNPAPLPANTDPYLQVHFNEAETDIIFTMLGTTWGSACDTPTEVIIMAANLPDGEWTEVIHLTDMQNDFTSFSPDRYESPHIALGAAYTDVRFVVKRTINAAISSRYDSNGNPFVSLGRFQVYRAVEGEPDPIDPKDNINLLFIGNSITAGATLSNSSSEAPPIVCGQLVGEATGVQTNVYNGGHSGITTLGFLPGRDDFTRVMQAAKAYQRNNGGFIYFSIMLGTNDSACSGTEGAPVSPDTYGTNIKKIIEALIAGIPNCKILLNYPIWYSPNTYNGARYMEEGLERLHSYYPILDAIVEEYDQVYAGNRGVWEFFEDNKVLFTKEGGNAGDFFLHPNVYGAQRLAEIWAKSLLELIREDGVEITNPLPEWNTFQPSNDKKYTISTPRGKYGTKDDKWTNTVKTGIDATEGEFAVITYEGQTYLYSVADKKFAYHDPNPDGNGWYTVLFNNSFVEPTKIHYTGVNANYPYCITMGGFIANSASSTNTGVVVNSWNSATDGGNQTAFVEAGEFDPTEALAALDAYFSNQLEVIYRIVDAEGHVLEELTATGQVGDVISEVPDHVSRHAYTTYTVQEPVTLVKGQENVVLVTATWTLPFELSPDINNAHWYNLALREGADIVTAANNYVCDLDPTKEELMSNEYQWAFQGNPYDGIIVYNRSDVTKTLAKVDNKAILTDGVYKWKIIESEKGFLLANNEDGKYINEYGGAGGYLGFWHNVSDVGSIFTVSEVGVQSVLSVQLSTGASLKIFFAPADKANGRSIVVIPGGGYSYVAGSSEGADWAPMLNDLGYAAAVLTYTTPPTAPDGPLTQGRSALKYLRDNAEEFGLKTDEIGVMGFSAGGHLASTIATHTTGDERPAFQILFYPVITMDASFTHAGSRENLIGTNPSQELIDLYSNEKQVTSETPQAYLCWADNDGTVPPRNSLDYAAALREAGVRVHTKNFPTGGHGYGFKTSYEYHDQMVADLTEWLLNLKFAMGPVTTIFYDINFNGEVVETLKLGGVEIGEAVPEIPSDLNREFVTYSLDTSGSVTENLHVPVTATWTGPFEFSTAEESNWYNLKVGRMERIVGWEDREPYHPQAYGGASVDGSNPQTEIYASALVRASDAYQWKFMGDPFNGIKVVNKLKGDAYSLTVDGAGSAQNGTANIKNTVLREGDFRWDIHADNAGFSLNLIGQTNYYINTYGGPRGYLQVWETANAQRDQGSQIIAEAVPDPEISMLNVGDYYYGTLCLPYDVTVSGASVYTIDDEGIGDEKITATPVEAEVPAGTPVLLRSTTGSVTLAYGEGFASKALTSNCFKGTYIPTKPANSLSLQNVEEVIGFYAIAESLEPNQAYLKLSDTSVKALPIEFGEGDGVRVLENGQSATDNVYDLGGRQMDHRKLSHGVYIIDGKKMLVK